MEFHASIILSWQNNANVNDESAQALLHTAFTRGI